MTFRWQRPVFEVLVAISLAACGNEMNQECAPRLAAFTVEETNAVDPELIGIPPNQIRESHPNVQLEALYDFTHRNCVSTTFYVQPDGSLVTIVSGRLTYLQRFSLSLQYGIGPVVKTYIPTYGDIPLAPGEVDANEPMNSLYILPAGS